jgi:hypothetical protein
MVKRMSLSALPGTTPWYRRRASSWNALRQLPTRSLSWLYLAVFFLFAIFGFYLNILTPHRLPLLLVLLLCFANGAYSVLYPWLLIRHPTSWTWALVVIQILWTGRMSWFAAVSDLRWIPGPTTSLVLTAHCLWALLVLSYFFFIAFIRKQATAAFRIQNELELAQGIQQTLVPPVSNTSQFYEIYGITRPSERVGGDLVDLIPSHDSDIAYVADVAGHGLQAGILMGMLKAAARTALLEPADSSRRLPLLLDRLDCVLPAVKENHMYAAFAALQLSPFGKVRHAVAGHPPVLHYAKATETFRELKVEQFPLGLIPGASFSASEIDIAQGDLLVIATDGILEAANAEDREFEISGLESCIATHRSASLPLLASSILNAVAAWGKQQDDQTLLIVRRL